jgi:hypothetical protein
MEDYKKKVIETTIEKQLHPVMNNTKWEKLRNEVLKLLPFPPPFQAKYVLEESPLPESFDSDVSYWGDWDEALTPFYSIEWIKVRPRYLKHQGVLVTDEVIDITNEFITLLNRLKIPYRKDNNAYYIYGYVSNDDLNNLESI